MKKNWRNSTQRPLPHQKTEPVPGNYDIYPAFKMADGKIFTGYRELAEIISRHRLVIIDGFEGVFFSQFRSELTCQTALSELKITWLETSDFLKPEEEINELISPFTGGNDPVFGRLATFNLRDFFEQDFFRISPDADSDINIIIGPGASLAACNGLLIYADLPKNELQYRARACSVTNLGASAPMEPGSMYKRFYFVDWVVLNKHKKEILSKIDFLVDAANPEMPVFISGGIFRQSLSDISHNVFRVRPWFEPGVWGGTWIKEHIQGLNTDVQNYAWSFELIVPENGLLLVSSGILMEFSFDFLMYAQAEAVIGEDYRRFGYQFPIRFDFLDTFNGGNLSIQCHPEPAFIKEQFGESFTQEETYYILDCTDNASVYLGFNDNIKPEEFRKSLLDSFTDTKEIDIEQFVMKHKSSKHDLFLIPYGTVHGSGKDNLVLEISTTPYIYTFKLYDWVRPDLNGKPRPLNIDRGIENLNFDRKGEYVIKKLIPKPVRVNEGEDWQLYQLPTHETHSYDVYRYHFKSKLTIFTNNKCHVLSLVEGTSVIVRTGNNEQRFNYAETFVIPAATGEYTVTNESGTEAIIVKAHIR
jgi:mannose-6-phosphate isomerase class I